jgi:hypothetical protein
MATLVGLATAEVQEFGIVTVRSLWNTLHLERMSLNNIPFSIQIR